MVLCGNLHYVDSMRIKLKRNCLSYIVCATVLSFLVTLYVIGLRNNKQVGTNFNLKPIRHKVRRDIHGLNKEFSSLSKNAVNSLREDKRILGQLEGDSKDRGRYSVTLDRAIPSTSTPTPLDTLNDLTEKALNVYIVEEHHEVIPYWFGEARRGVIPKTGNTLIHIDGHSDLAPPQYMPGYPFFKWPSEKQLKYFMQRNDAFIQAAAMAGMINRFVWVWPDWDRQNHGGRYEMNTLNLGWAYVTEGNRKTKEKTFCMCMISGGESECLSNENAEGAANEGSEEEEEDFGYKISQKNCKIKKRVIVEEVHESKAISYLVKSDWLSDNENIILDIDEDYFGCTYAIRPLLKANVSQAKIDKLDETISSQLCPLSIADEKESDGFLMDLIGTVRVQRACKIDPKLVNSTKCQKMSKINILNFYATLFNAKVSEKSIHVCDDTASEVFKFIQSIQQQLARFRIKQLRALQETGFCSSTSTKSFMVDARFSICYGANTPEHTQVLEHIPTLKEIEIRTEILENILLRLNNFSPKLVTVCRSVRDGYTPRSYFELIEKNVLSTLNTSLDRELNIHYDRDLIGGKPGWPSRHKA